MKTIHQVHYGWDRSLEPLQRIRSGQTLSFAVQEASGGQLRANSVAEEIGKLSFERINPVSGPIYIEGAVPGDVLEVEILELRRSDWGWTAIIPGFGLLADQFPDPALHIWQIGHGPTATFDRGFEIPIAPFPGTIGVALAEPGHHSIVPPRHNGGNMDIRHLMVGSRLRLPVWVEGALFSVGDTHAAQGDGEVCGTAIESPMEITLRFNVLKGQSLHFPQFITRGPLTPGMEESGYHVTTGIADDLMGAARRAVLGMIDHLTSQYRLEPEQAYMLCSVAVDLKLCEVVDAPNWLVGAYLPLATAP